VSDWLIVIVGMCLVLEIALAFWWVKSKIDWLRDVLVPLLARAHRDIDKLHRDILVSKLRRDTQVGPK
jgi:hypothetical protein